MTQGMFGANPDELRGVAQALSRGSGTVEGVRETGEPEIDGVPWLYQDWGDRQPSTWRRSNGCSTCGEHQRHV